MYQMLVGPQEGENLPQDSAPWRSSATLGSAVEAKDRCEGIQGSKREGTGPKRQRTLSKVYYKERQRNKHRLKRGCKIKRVLFCLRLHLSYMMKEMTACLYADDPKERRGGTDNTGERAGALWSETWRK